jgi:MFS family permease
MKRAFAQAGFGRLYAGLTTSAFGDSVMLLVLSMWVKTLTGSNAQAGLTFLFMLLPSLVAPALGVWVDKFRRRPLLVWGNLASAAMLMPLLLVHRASDVWILWTVAFCYGVSFVVLPAGVNGLLKELLPDDALVDANAALQTTKEAFRLVGPLVGAAIFAWLGGGVVALVDAVSFVAAAAVLSTIAIREEEPAVEESHLWHRMAAGVAHLVGDRVLRDVLVGFGLMQLVIGFTEASIYAVLDGFGKPPTFAGVVLTAQGVGAVAGGLASNRVVRRIGEVSTAVLSMVILSAGILVVAVTHSLGVMLVAVAVLGIAIPPLFVSVMTLIQRRTPQQIMGRVSLATEVVLGTPQAISLAVGAMLVAVLSYHVIFAIIAVVTMLGAAYIVARLRDDMRADWRAGRTPSQVDDGALVGE